jgi:hypothetical protein
MRPTSRALAGAVHELLDRHLAERRRLRWRQLFDRRDRICAAEKGPDEIRHVGARDLGELDQDLMRACHRALRGGLGELGDALGKLRIS